MNKPPVPVCIDLENGTRFEGMGHGDFSNPRGAEFVFCTAMTGIEESLTDPSFAGQALVSTPSHVGNTGYTQDDCESGKIWAEGLICRHLESQPSNWRAKTSLGDWIVSQKRFVVSGIDTRGFTTVLRESGSQRGCVSERGRFPNAVAAAEWIRGNVPDMNGRDLTVDVSCATTHDFTGVETNAYWPWTFAGPKSRGVAKQAPRIAVWDFGVKTNTLRLLSNLGANVVVVPARSSAADLLEAGRDGILLSNGPGDPAAATHVLGELKHVLGRKPMFAICLGHQLVALAAGAKTYKMKFGHRGTHHPVVELDKAGRALRTWITSQNHGFAVDAQSLPASVRVSFTHADDASVEGLSLPELNCETVQFHPEAAPGPFDSGILLKRFMKGVTSRGSA